MIMSTFAKNSLNPLSGPIKDEDLKHLLRRCLFGFDHKEFSEFKGKKISDCLDVLLTQSAIPKMLTQEDPDVIDPLVPKGKPWINAPYENEIIDKRRRIYLKSWWVGQIINRDLSLTEKMVLFWHNHFVTQIDSVQDARYSYQYIMLLRKNAIGNFKSLIKEGITNPAMLVYLNGNTNNKDAPNENFSRELLELFTLGKSEDIHYTERDVKEIAKILSGWQDDKEEIKSVFNPSLHDTSDKQFSAFFDHTLIKGRKGLDGKLEVTELVEMIFKKKEVAIYFCKNIYRWFVSSFIDEAILTTVILPLSELLIKSNFDVKPVLKKLLNSEHFFESKFKGCIVKSPVDFFVGVSKQFDINFPEIDSENHLCWIHYNYYLGGLSMFLGDPPSVAGWPAFSQSPKFHQWWINSYTLGFRFQIIESLASSEGMLCNGPKIQFDFLSFSKNFYQFHKIDSFLLATTNFCLAIPLGISSLHQLKQKLIGDKSESQWEETWMKQGIDKNNANLKDSWFHKGLTDFFVTLLNMPEFQMQ